VIGDAAVRACPLCGSRDEAQVIDRTFDASHVGRLSFASRKPPELMHWRLVTCPSCGLVYASPAPTGEELLREYRDAGFDAADESRYAAATYAGLVAKLLPSLPDRDGALDIGAGDGAFLERLLGLGFGRVVGLEPSPAARAGASARVRDSIREQPFEAGALDAGSFSLVSCLQTIEHLPEPLEACREAGRLLKPGGALLVVCHDRRAWSARLLGRRSPIYDIEHLQLFDRATLLALLERSGFERIEVHGLVNRYPLAYWLRLARAPARFVRALDPVASLAVTVPAGNLWAVGYRPRGSV
jgi:SAM-dependent methyltransferase